MIDPEDVIPPDSNEAEDIYKASQTIEDRKFVLLDFVREKQLELMVEGVPNPQELACAAVSLRCYHQSPSARTLRGWLEDLDGLDGMWTFEGETGNLCGWVETTLTLTHARYDKTLAKLGKCKRGEAIKWAVQNYATAEMMYAEFIGDGLTKDERHTLSLEKALTSLFRRFKLTADQKRRIREIVEEK